MSNCWLETRGARSLNISTQPAWQACSNAVAFCIVINSTSAPHDNSFAAISTWPRFAAYIRGVCWLIKFRWLILRRVPSTFGESKRLSKKFEFWLFLSNCVINIINKVVLGECSVGAFKSSVVMNRKMRCSSAWSLTASASYILSYTSELDMMFQACSLIQGWW